MSEYTNRKRLNRLHTLGINVLIDHEGIEKFGVKCPSCLKERIFTSMGHSIAYVKEKNICLDCKSSKKYGIWTENGLWYRECPKCFRDIEHNSKTTCRQSASAIKICKSCRSICDDEIPTGVFLKLREGKWGKWYRTCKHCSRKIPYKSKKSAINAQLKFSGCGSCTLPVWKGRPMSEIRKAELSNIEKRRWANPSFKKKIRSIFSNAAKRRWARERENV
jgi:Zn ribbon nucleic-acid-binding protein